MDPIHKFNNGNGATLCHNCNVIISYGLTNDLICPSCLDKLFLLKQLTGKLIDILESVETSDSGTDFHPTKITSCRVQDTMCLQEIMPKITEIVNYQPDYNSSYAYLREIGGTATIK
jgi:hypothetical protein